MLHTHTGMHRVRQAYMHTLRCSASHYICIYIQIYTQYAHTDTNSKSHKLINASMHGFMCIRHTRINMWLCICACACCILIYACVCVCEHSYYCTSIQSHLVHAITAYQCVDYIIIYIYYLDAIHSIHAIHSLDMLDSLLAMTHMGHTLATSASKVARWEVCWPWVWQCVAAFSACSDSLSPVTRLKSSQIQ